LMDPFEFPLKDPIPTQVGDTPGVYKITHQDSGDCYVGSSLRLRSRIRGHRKGLRVNKHENQHLQNAWNKYGSDAFTYSVLEYVPTGAVIPREQFWMDTLHPVYNIAKIAGSNAGNKLGPMSQSQKDKIGAANRGKVASQETRDFLSSIRKGVPKSQAFKDNLSRVLTGRVPTDTHRANLSKSLKGRLFGSALRESQKTHCPHGHEYNQENTSWEGPGNRSRICKVCRRLRQKASRNRPT
jgi:group I intron endonuclease